MSGEQGEKNITIEEALAHSAVRGNLVEWIPFDGTERVLVPYGAAEAIYDVLRRKTASVDTEPQAEEYDWLLLADDPAVRKFPDAREALQQYGAQLKKGGRLILAVYNRYGARALSGDPDPYTGRAFSAPEGRRGSHGEVLEDLQKMLSENHFSGTELYYPAPDHIFPTEIYSDAFLPGEGNIRTGSIPLLDGGFSFMNEARLLNQAILDGKFSTFANSYLLLAKKD